jgi:AcrR family transcriptional regulator
VASTRRGRAESPARVVILDTTEQLMVDEGYAAVTTRRVAAQAGLTAPLVHYYFPTTDDLLLAVYRRAADRNIERVSQALAGPKPLRELWAISVDRSRTTLAVEFMAMANHRKIIGREIAANIERSRALQAELLARLLREQGIDPREYPEAGLCLMFAGISRALVMEAELGVTVGHAEAGELVESWLRRFDSGRKPRRSAARK